jgi:MYXO-CTERM domain-containing protein
MRATEWMGAALAALLAVEACSNESASSVRWESASPAGLVAAAAAQVSPKSAVPDGLDTGATQLPNTTVDLRVLVITTDGSDPAAVAAQNALSRLGTPFDVHNATQGPRLTADQLASGTHGRYNAILLDRGALLTGGGASAFTDAEWKVLATYEASFGVRRAALYTLPDAGYGFGDTVATASGTVTARCTSAGTQLFTGANCGNPITIAGAVVYSAPSADPNSTPLLTDGAGHPLAVTRRYPDGREALALTFSQADGATHTTQLLYGVIRWATRGLFLGERHAYAGVQIDDLFLASRMYDGSSPVRITDADLQAFFDWQKERQQNAVTAGFRAAFCVNAAKAVDGDALTAKAQAIGSGFAWIDHTWDHQDMTSMDYATAFSEFTRNDDRVAQLGLMPYDTSVAVTPDVSGLANANVLGAAAATGIRYLVSDTSQPGYGNPKFNEGIPSTIQPGMLLLPRRPTDLYYSVSTPAQWVNEYNARNGTALDYPTIVDKVSAQLLGYLLRGENDPWMFHQADTFDYGGGHSLLSDLLDATFDKYAALMTLPIVSPTMAELGARVEARDAYDTAGAAAWLAPDGSVTVHVASNAATVPMTGFCTPAAESYAGDWISYIDVAPGADVRLTPGCAGAAVGHPASPPTETDAAAPAHVADAGTPPATGGGSPAGRQDSTAGMDAGAAEADGGADGGIAPIAHVSVVPSPSGGFGCSCAATAPGPPPLWAAVVSLLAALLLIPRRRDRY